MASSTLVPTQAQCKAAFQNSMQYEIIQWGRGPAWAAWAMARHMTRASSHFMAAWRRTSIFTVVVRDPGRRDRLESVYV
jgi:hypothetical protein